MQSFANLGLNEPIFMQTPAIQNAGGVNVQGVIDGFAPIEYVSNDMADIIPGRDILLVTVPAQAHKFYAEEMSPWIESGQTLLIMPGATGGAIEFSNIIEAQENATDFILGEAQTFSFVSRIVNPDTVLISKIKNKVRVSALPASSNQKFLRSLSRLPLDFVLAKNVLETSLGNVNAMLHPAPMVLSAGLIESQCGGFLHYHDLISESVGNLIERMDKERMKIAEMLSIESPSILEWLMEVYDAEGEPLCECLKSIDTYDNVTCATDLSHRYIHEDIPTGLVPISDFGELVGVEPPAIDSIILIGEQICKRNYRSTGRSIDSLGLSGMSIENLVEFADSGIKNQDYLPLIEAPDLPLEDI
ncbi:MAG: NAD/NADP octopine/nopaline dehydrogenase family protein [Candidatus Thorarchaeota archaeon]|nr:NAD/NADP octopine/nopaline dehydrogenase family protein [Candidatus Thorarchaeota archaeon]